MKTIIIAFIVLFSSQFLLAQDNSGGKISGYMFGDYFYNAARDTGISSLSNVVNGGKKDLNGFQLRRIYFTYDYTISENFSSRFRLEADQTANTSDGKVGVFVKDAYLNGKIFLKAVILFLVFSQHLLLKFRKVSGETDFWKKQLWI